MFFDLKMGCTHDRRIQYRPYSFLPSFEILRSMQLCQRIRVGEVADGRVAGEETAGAAAPTAQGEGEEVLAVVGEEEEGEELEV